MQQSGLPLLVMWRWEETKRKKEDKFVCKVAYYYISLALLSLFIIFFLSNVIYDVRLSHCVVRPC